MGHRNGTDSPAVDARLTPGGHRRRAEPARVVDGRRPQRNPRKPALRVGHLVLGTVAAEHADAADRRWTSALPTATRPGALSRSARRQRPPPVTPGPPVSG